MKTKRCRACGAQLTPGAKSCPACGAGQAPSLSRVWVLTFFVMGILIGLLLLVLQQGVPSSWQFAELPVFSGQGEKSPPPSSPAKSHQTKSEQPRIEPPRIEPLRCDREAAEKVYQRARSLASISVQGSVLQLALTREWEYYSAGHRRGFVEAFSEADRCLQGHFRELHFLFQGHEVATVSDAGAVQMK